MKDIKAKEDKLMQIDFNSAYPATPDCIHQAIRAAETDIRRYQQKKARQWQLICFAAAAVVVLIGLAVIFRSMGNGKNSDVVTPPVLGPNGESAAMSENVYTSKSDPYYHLDPDCSLMDDYSVDIPLVTAQEFEKAPCPNCAVNMQ